GRGFGRISAMVVISRRPEEDVAEDRRGLPPRRYPVPPVHGGPPRRSALARGSDRASAAGCPLFYCGPDSLGPLSGIPYTPALPDAQFRALSRTPRQRQGRRAECRARAEDREDLAETTGGSAGKARLRYEPARRRGARALDLRARCGSAGAVIRLGPAHRRSA